jgi:hypothetical protein
VYKNLRVVAEPPAVEGIAMEDHSEKGESEAPGNDPSARHSCDSRTKSTRVISFLHSSFVTRHSSFVIRYTPAAMISPLRILYLLEDTDLSGGVRIQLAQADALISRGHRVTIATKGSPLSWIGSEAEWLYVDSFSEVDPEQYDYIIGGFWTTVRPAYDLAPAKAVHLCQGYEGSFQFYEAQRGEIERTYRLPVPKLVVGTHLVEICRAFFDDVTWIGQIVDESFFRATAPPDNHPMRVLLSGASQIDIKGIDDGYGAAAHAVWNGAELELIRVSPWAPAGDEPLDSVAEFHVALGSTEMTRLMHSCDILLAPNHREEGFGLPAAEAMASGLPVVMTRIPSYLSFGSPHDYALFANEGDSIAMGDALLELLYSEGLRQRLRTRGRQIAGQFHAEEVARRMETFFLDRTRLREKGPSR